MHCLLEYALKLIRNQLISQVTVNALGLVLNYDYYGSYRL